MFGGGTRSRAPGRLCRHGAAFRCGPTVARAVVLGGGGIVGVAWGCGYLAGLEEGGVSLADADEVCRYSAGSIVAAWLTSGSRSRAASALSSDRTARSNGRSGA